MFLRSVGCRIRCSGSAQACFRSGPSSALSSPILANHFNKVVHRKFSVWDSYIGAIENGILKYHEFVGLPWWLTIASSTVAVRLALFPLIRLQILNTSEFTRLGPYLSLLKSLLMRRLLVMKSDPTASPVPILKAYFKGFYAAKRHTRISFTKFLGYPLLNLFIFVTFIYAIRRLARGDEKARDMEVGGEFWFKNLTKKDPSHIMPITACFLTYLTLFLTFNRMQNQTKKQIFGTIRDWMSSISILALPMTAYQPAAVFCYWIPSSALAAVQSYVLQNQRMRTLLRLPAVAELAKEAGRKSNIRPSFDPIYFTLYANKNLKFRPKHLPYTNKLLY